MDRQSWGPHFWATLHIAALANGPQFKDFAETFPGILPCTECSQEFYKILSMYPVTDDPFRWSVDVHNAVNRKLGKRVVSYDEAKRRWSRNEMSLHWYAIVAVLIIGIVIGLAIH